MRTHHTRPPLMMAAVGSTLIAAVGVLWLIAPERYPFGPGDKFGVDASLLAATDADLAAGLAVGAGAIGLLTAACFATRPARGAPYLLGAAGAQAVVLGLLVPDQQVLVLAAYVLALVVPPILSSSPTGCSSCRLPYGVRSSPSLSTPTGDGGPRRYLP